jgi:glycerol kinase
MELVLALDAGTTGVRALAVAPDTSIVDSAYRELTQYFPSPGLVEHDANEIAQLSLAVLGELARRVHSQGHRVVALGLTNQRETTVAFDRDDERVKQRALVWQDRRTAQLCERLRAQGHEDQVRQSTGLILDPYFSGTKMRWLLDHGALDDASAPALATIDAYLIWVLTGGVDGGAFVTEPSNASRTMLFDLATMAWSSSMCDLLGVASSLLPEVRASAGRFGVVAPAVLSELAGVAITGVLGDQQAALFGQACFEPGMVKATYGTGAFILANAGDQVPTPVHGLLSTVAWDLGAFGPANYAFEGSAFVAGAAVQWMRDELGFFEHASELSALAAQVPDSAGVIFVPAFSGLGSPFWRPDARGSLSGLTRGTSRAHIARAVLEAQAFQVRAITDAFAHAGVALRELRADGGASAMDEMLQLQATLSRLAVRRGASVEATALGAAMIAMLGAGLAESLEELSHHWLSQFEAFPGDAQSADVNYAAWLRAVERS